MNLDNEDEEVPDLVQDRSLHDFNRFNQAEQKHSMSEATDMKVPITIITGTGLIPVLAFSCAFVLQKNIVSLGLKKHENSRC